MQKLASDIKTDVKKLVDGFGSISKKNKHDEVTDEKVEIFHGEDRNLLLTFI